MKWLSRLVVLGAFAVLLFPALMSVSSVSAELTEAEKQALEAEQQDQEAPEAPEAPEPAPPPEDQEPAPPPEDQEPAPPAEDQEPAPPAEDQEPAPPAEDPEPAPPPEAPEAPEAPEPAPPPEAPEPPGGGQDQGGNVATDRLNGRISAFSPDSITVGIIGNNTFAVTGRTYITTNGQVSNLYRGVFVGDTVSVQFDAATNEALRIEIEGFGFAATYQDTGVEITYIGAIGHWPQDFGMHAGGAGLKLGAATQVTINGVPASYADLQVGDTIDYVMDATNLEALWLIVTR